MQTVLVGWRTMSLLVGYEPKLASARLFGAAMVLPQEMDRTIAGARRTLTELDFNAIYIGPNSVRGRNRHDPVNDPLCEELDILVGFHEGPRARCRTRGNTSTVVTRSCGCTSMSWVTRPRRWLRSAA